MMQREGEVTPQENRCKNGRSHVCGRHSVCPTTSGTGQGCCCDLGREWQGERTQRETDLKSKIFETLWVVVYIRLFSGRKSSHIRQMPL